MDKSRWPHLGEIAAGLIEARLSGVDFWDTDVGQRLLRGKRGDVPAQRGQEPAVNEPEGRSPRRARPG
jgi:hypothetical protein